LLAILPLAEEATEEVIFIVIEAVGGEELREDIVGMVEVKVTKIGSFGSIESIAIVGSAFL
jgi:hypothetical protein